MRDDGFGQGRGARYHALPGSFPGVFSSAGLSSLSSQAIDCTFREGLPFPLPRLRLFCFPFLLLGVLGPWRLRPRPGMADIPPPVVGVRVGA